MANTQHEQGTNPFYEPTGEGLGIALQDAVAQHTGAVVHSEATPNDHYGQTGGDKLRLYPNPDNPREVITISPVGINAEARRFPTTQFHVVYTKKRDDSSGAYRVSGTPDHRFVQRWLAHPDLPSALAVDFPTEKNYSDLITAITHASAERPPSRPSKMMQKLGSLTRKPSS